VLLDHGEVAYTAAELGLVVLVDPQEGIAAVVNSVRDLVRRTNARVVISHIGYPKLSAGRVSSGWELLDLADLQSVDVLLSGHAMWAAHPYAVLQELSSAIVREFGEGRVLWGSNFPVSDQEAVAKDIALLSDHGFGLVGSGATLALRENALRLWWGDNASESPLSSAASRSELR
jgi:predicted TIM-barrel fold metal-dependent hydrolase